MRKSKNMISKKLQGYINDIIAGNYSSIDDLNDLPQEEKNKFFITMIAILFAKNKETQDMIDMQVKINDYNIGSINTILDKQEAQNKNMISICNLLKRLGESNNSNGLKSDAVINYLNLTGQAKVEFSELNDIWQQLVSLEKKGKIKTDKKSQEDKEPTDPQIVDSFLASLKFTNKKKKNKNDPS